MSLFSPLASTPVAESNLPAANSTRPPFSVIDGWWPMPTIFVMPASRSRKTTLSARSNATYRPSPLMLGWLLSPAWAPAAALSSVTCRRALSSTYTSLHGLASSATSREYVVKATNRPSALTAADAWSKFERCGSRCSTVSIVPTAIAIAAAFIARARTVP